MNGRLVFEVPYSLAVIVDIIRAIPLTWSWMDGFFQAPEELIKNGSATENTGFAIQRFHDIHPTIIGRYDRIKKETKKPDIFAIMVERKLPGFVSFDEAGYDTSISFNLARQIAIGFIFKEYHGNLSFYKDCYNDSKYQNPARCFITFQGHKGGQLCLEWEKRFGGKRKDIEPILLVCRSHRLRRHRPSPTQ